jgi:4,5-dihydroxyphthalate decarboxylase
MSTLPLTLACTDYDLTHPLICGTVRAQGIDLKCITLGSTEIFRRMLRYGEFDASELSLSNYILGLSRGDTRFVGLPIFPYRAFRHSMIWVNTDSIRQPKDLIGKRMGIPEYATTALLFVRGMLQDEYGVRPEQIEWLRGREERVDLDLPSNVHVNDAGSDQALEAMLEEEPWMLSQILKPLASTAL